jgi:hypothetical protein
MNQLIKTRTSTVRTDGFFYIKIYASMLECWHFVSSSAATATDDKFELKAKLGKMRGIAQL